MTRVDDLVLEDPDGAPVRLGDLVGGDGGPRLLVVQLLRYYG